MNPKEDYFDQLDNLRTISTAQLAEEFLMSYTINNAQPVGNNRDARNSRYVHERLLDAGDHLDADRGTVDIPQAIRALELALRLDICDGEFIPDGCDVAELLHRLLTLEINQAQGDA
jgi:hypothetical protein